MAPNPTISAWALLGDVHKSAAIASFQTINENKSCFPKSFWCEGSENLLTEYTIHTYVHCITGPDISIYSGKIGIGIVEII